MPLVHVTKVSDVIFEKALIVEHSFFI